MNSISRGFKLHDTFVTGMYATSMKINSRVASRLDKVQAGMDAIVHDFLPVDAVFLFEVRVETGFDVLNDRFPARMEHVRIRQGMNDWNCLTYLSSLLTKSPKPGVSTTVRRRRTPFSSMSGEIHMVKVG